MNTLKNFKSIPKRLLSVVLALMLMLSIFPVQSIFAAGNGKRDAINSTYAHHFYNANTGADLFCMNMRRVSDSTGSNNSEDAQTYFRDLSYDTREKVRMAIAVNRKNKNWQYSTSKAGYCAVQLYIWNVIHTDVGDLSTIQAKQTYKDVKSLAGDKYDDFKAAVSAELSRYNKTVEYQDKLNALSDLYIGDEVNDTAADVFDSFKKNDTRSKWNGNGLTFTGDNAGSFEVNGSTYGSTGAKFTYKVLKTRSKGYEATMNFITAEDFYIKADLAAFWKFGEQEAIGATMEPLTASRTIYSTVNQPEYKVQFKISKRTRRGENFVGGSKAYRFKIYKGTNTSVSPIFDVTVNNNSSWTSSEYDIGAANSQVFTVVEEMNNQDKLTYVPSDGAYTRQVTAQANEVCEITTKFLGANSYFNNTEKRGDFRVRKMLQKVDGNGKPVTDTSSNPQCEPASDYYFHLYTDNTDSADGKSHCKTMSGESINITAKAGADGYAYFLNVPVAYASYNNGNLIFDYYYWLEEIQKVGNTYCVTNKQKVHVAWDGKTAYSQQYVNATTPNVTNSEIAAEFKGIRLSGYLNTTGVPDSNDPFANQYKDADGNLPTSATTSNYINLYKTFTAKAIKVDELTGTYKGADYLENSLGVKTKGHTVEGAKFNLIWDNGSGEKTVGTYSADATGNINISDAHVAKGKYYLKEASTDNPILDFYKLNEKKYLLFDHDAVTSDEWNNWGTTKVITLESKIPNTPVPGKAKIVKTGEDGEKLQGAKFGLFADGTAEEDLKESNAIDVKTTDANGQFEFTNLSLGKYIVAELEAPKDYVKCAPQTVTIDEYAQVVELSLKDVLVKGQIKVKKEGEVFYSAKENDKGGMDIEYRTMPLRDVVFEVKAAEDIYTYEKPEGVLRHHRGDVVATITSGKDGIASTDTNLYFCKYNVIENERKIAL